MNHLRQNKIHLRKRWRQRFYIPVIQWMYAARNAPHRVILVSNESGKFELHAKDFVTNVSCQLTKRPDGTLFGSVSRDGQYVYYVDDKQGSEYGHFVRILFVGGRTIDITPRLPRYFSYTTDTGDKADLLAFTASISNGKENRVYLVPFNTQMQPESPRLIFKSSYPISEPVISPNGIYTCLAISPVKLKSASDIILIRNFTEQPSSKPFLRVKGSFTPLAFSENTSRQILLGITNDRGFYRPIFLNFTTGNIERITDKNFLGDVFVLRWIEKEKKLLLCDVHKACHRLLLHDLGTKTTKRIGPVVGSFDLFFNAAALLPDDSILIKWQAFGTPSRILKLIAPDYKKTEGVDVPTYKPQRTLNNTWCRSSDGEKVQMWIARPSSRRGNPPFVIDLHGGPHGVVSDEFLPEAHAWLDHGFGYCTVNYRGSIGFGKQFEEKIYGNPGYWEVEDAVAAREWLVKKGWADPQRIIISGWSWGGYVTLLALGKYPNLWLGGVAGVPIADWILQYKDEPTSFRAIDRQYFGGTPKEVPQRYIRSSPITYTKKFRAPVFIIYGKNDVRCPPNQILSFERAMKKDGKSITIHEFNSGHAGGFTNTKIHVSNLDAVLQFAISLKNRSLPRQ